MSAGGRGGLLKAVLERHANVRGQLFDQPQVVAQAAALEANAALQGRFSCIAGNFFEAVPGGADTYLLKGVLHDFDDRRYIQILKNCRRAMQPQSKLLVIERLISPDNLAHQAKTIDVLMMVLLGGREWPASDWAELLLSADLRLCRQLKKIQSSPSPKQHRSEIMQEVAIAGAGLAGTLLAIALARRGYRVDIYERRPDPRSARADLGRSINLALSVRGARALKQVDLLEAVLANAVPMKARAIHSPAGQVAYQPFGRNADEYLSAIERHTLNHVLLDAAEAEPGVGLHFNQRLSGVDFSTMTLALEDRATGRTQQRSCQRLIGADGAYSAVRGAMVSAGLAEFAVGGLDFGYKELPISVEQALDLRLECLHLWPRRSFSMIANPNPDRSFSCTLFMAHDGREPSFGRLKEAGELQAMFRQHFPDALRAHAFVDDRLLRAPHRQHPHRQRWPVARRGQGAPHRRRSARAGALLRAGHEQRLRGLFGAARMSDRCKDRWDQALPAFFRARKANVDAIADMAMQNYREIQDYIADDAFLVRKRVEQELMQGNPELYTSMHVLVMFTTVPYVFAKACGALQGKLLDEICGGATSIEQIDWPAVEPRLQKYAEEVLRLRDAFQRTKP